MPFSRLPVNGSGGCLFGPLICGPHERISVDIHPWAELL
jgi:hypothetical protein